MSKEPSDRSRRTFLAEIAGALPIMMAMPVGIAEAEKQSARSEGRPLNVVCVGGHPDDPESGCGGTLARYADAGHKITVIYLTRGEAGIEGKSHDEAAAIRTAEAQAACKVLGATAVFAGQIDGDTRVDRKSSQVLLELVTAVEPDVVFTHWPLDTHPDHQARPAC
jgi:LmbE family N-acetylglucosaminyl deacetylase